MFNFFHVKGSIISFSAVRGIIWPCVSSRNTFHVTIKSSKSFNLFPFQDTLKAFDDFKSKRNSIWRNVLWYVKVYIYIFWGFIQYPIPWDKTQIKNSLFFLSWALSYHSFTFNSWFLYELKHKICLTKNVRGIFHFQFRFIFIKI